VTVSPVPVIVPTLLFPLRTPSTVQFTVVSDVFWTAALNCWVSFVNTLALLGVMLIAAGGVTVTAALADFVASAALVAVTAWDPPFAGAV
jgi:hypothetical protein